MQPPQRFQQPDADTQPERPSRSDNSNTQFAVLGLWAARRHSIPMDRALALVVWRFQTSQSRDGSWSYKYAAGGSSDGRPSMTGSALLGLAVGQGLTYDYRQSPSERIPPDPRIRRGLSYLAASLDPPIDRPPFEANPFLPGNRQQGSTAHVVFPRGRVPPDFDSYLLWTIERVGVLYNLRSLDGRDWYRWGVGQLLAVQQSGGGWPYGRGQERDMVGTSFALLFLKGSNLVADLTSKLEAAVERK
jgi:hypothetical protein